MTKEEVRAIVREEIVKTMAVMVRSARYESRTQDREIESRAAEAVEAVADGVARRMTCEHEFKDYQPDTCWSCDEPSPEPVDPFCTHAYDMSKGEPTDCIQCGAPYPKKDRTSD
jgi:hypothetical protein